MRRTNRLGGAAAGLLASALVLAACGSDDDGGGGGGGDPSRNADATEVTLTITSNAIKGGKNTEEATWITDWVIPEFTAMKKEQGVDVTVEFEANGVDDEEYKTKIALDLQSDSGADIIGIDGIWTGEFAEAGYIEPLTEVAGEGVDDWDGWEQIPEAVQQAMSFEDQKYGIPLGTDGRVIYFNKELFAQAGLPADWQPTSWQEILDAARQLQQLDGVTPLQINAGTAMGEATTMQGFLPLLAGTGELVWNDGEWTGGSEGVTETLGFYADVYGGDQPLGDPLIQQEAQGRDTSFQMFANGELGMLIESDYLWRSVINPDGGIAPMQNRDEAVGWAKIPAREPGAGINGQDFVSMSGGTGRVLNPNTEYPQQAWELLRFMNSPEAFEAMLAGSARITPRDDVNATALADDPMLTFVAEEVLPITAYRPSLAAYPQVSVALQEATASVVSGTSPDEAASTYQSELEGIIGDDGAIAD
ncbi:carbohydrate ABC transporter substrate-binding protein (CUT1 family) [Haloactinopolyspora alba]|uniref:Carbohydrate ABC transporter substrate-binding protein (CUT1 family) n=1 Tax=Haloactinopolyspora alba TaxID=648780 RepID=A0A2P8DZX2_9ACTN|nr:extracellular solute-binding protein [Haloactinopolyspora alba]PSL02754.1 carbohydrate ABC transporter substrate-binding protein (CUT1 family) [Haloactinopolyspora alba]